MNKNSEIAISLAMLATKPENSTFIINLLKKYIKKNDVIDEEKLYIELVYLKYCISIICINVMLEEEAVKPILDEAHKEIYNFLNKIYKIEISDFNKICGERFNEYREINSIMTNKSNDEFTVLDCGNAISKNFLGTTNPILSAFFISIYTEEIKYLKNLITRLNEKMSECCKKLCEDIKLYYLKDFDICCKENGNWVVSSDKSMKNYTLSRYGWEKSDKSEDTFLFMKKYPITISIIYSGSPGTLMLDTAIGIAKAELIINLKKNESTEDYISRIVECVKNQNWVIPFIRKKA